MGQGVPGLLDTECGLSHESQKGDLKRVQLEEELSHPPRPRPPEEEVVTVQSPCNQQSDLCARFPAALSLWRFMLRSRGPTDVKSMMRSHKNPLNTVTRDRGG